jgi:hypothetical protein
MVNYQKNRSYSVTLKLRYTSIKILSVAVADVLFPLVGKLKMLVKLYGSPVGYKHTHLK